MQKNNKYIQGIKKALKWVLYSAVLLFIILYLLLRMAAVQTYIADQTARKLSEIAGFDISIGAVDISGFLNISINNINVHDHHDSLFLKVKSIKAEIIPSYLIEDKIFVKNLCVDSLFLALIEYKGEDELNIVKVIESFITENTDSTNIEFSIKAKEICVTNSYFALDLQNSDHFDGMDYTHLNVDNINILVHDFSIKGDSIIGKIDKFTANEKCGFNISSLQGNALVSPREIEIPNFDLLANNSSLKANLNLRYEQWPDWLDFIDKVRFDATVDNINLNLNDIRFFSTTLDGMDNTFSGGAIVKGTVASLRVRSADLKYKNKSYFKGKVALIGLPDLEQTFIRVKITDANIDAKEFASLKLPKGQKIEIPDIANKYEFLRINGRFTGFYYDFVSKADFNSALGRFSTDISLQPTANDEDFKYSGKLSTRNFKLQKLFGSSYISNITMEASINGVGLNENIVADYNIDIKEVTVANFYYTDLSLVGNIDEKRLNTELISKNDSFRLNANGYYDLSDSLPHVFIDASMLNARVNRFFMVHEDTLGHFTGDVIVDVIGSDIDNVQGYINIHNVDFEYHNNRYSTDSFYVESYINNSFRQLSVKSNDLDMDISGFRRFSDFPIMAELLFNNVLPNITNFSSFSGTDPIAWSRSNDIADEQIVFDVNFHEINSFVNIYVPKFKIAKDSRIKGNYTFFNDSLYIEIESDKIVYDQFRASVINLKLQKSLSEIKLDLSSNYLRTFGGIYFDTLYINGGINMDTADFAVSWGGNNYKNKGDILGSIFWTDTSSFELLFYKGEFYVQDTLWTLNPRAQVKSSHHSLMFTDFDISHKSNSLKIHGKSTDNPDDNIICDFDNVDVSFSDFYFKKFNTDLDGYVNGELHFSNIWLQPTFTGDISISYFKVNGFDLNTFNMHSDYSKSQKAFMLDATIGSDTLGLRYLNLGGLYYPFKKDNQLEVQAQFSEFPLKSIEEYLSSFTSNINGEINGSLDLSGTLKEPIILGKWKTDINDVLVDYTNVHYKISDYFVFTSDYFGFIDVDAKDVYNKKLLLTTKISHDYYSDFKVDIDVRPINAQLLNTTVADNELFYGRAFGNGSFQLKGSFNDMAIKLNMKPNNKSYLAIPISDQTSAEYSDFLTFIQKDTVIVNREIEDISTTDDDQLALSLDMTLDIDPSTTIELVMDDRVGDVISANGNGRIKIEYDNDGTYKMFGKYVIDRGNYLFTMQSVLNKRFIIESGSEIIWDGELESAKINVKAIYRVDAKLYDLFQSVVDSASSTVYKKPSKVNCIINITGSLLDPTISFDIKVPDESIADQELVNRLLSVESTGNSEELNKNFVSLLILGRFQPPSGYESGANPNMLQHNATEILAEQVGNILNQVSDDVEIGLEWSPGDDVTTQEVAVALSYSMLDDRLILDGKFGQGGGSTAENSVRVVADMEIGYKLTPDGRIRAKVFNRTNYYDPLSRKAPYTQGVGVTFRKDFDNFKQLLKKKKKSDEEKAELNEKEKNTDKEEVVDFKDSKKEDKNSSKNKETKEKNSPESEKVIENK